MATNKTNTIQSKIKKDKTFIPNIQKWLKKEVDQLKSEWLSRDAINKALSDRLNKGIGADGIQALRDGVKKQNNISSNVWPEPELFAEPKDTTVDTPIQQENITQEPTTQLQTLRERVAKQVAGRKTREELLIEAREDGWRQDLLAQQEAFWREARNVLEDIENISKGLESEGWAITNIAASRIREARSAPLRETLTSLVKWQELTAESIEQLDKSLEWILEARRLDREDEIGRLASEIEASDLSWAEKQELISELQVQTAQSKQRDELEIFRQKEQIKADIEAREQESIASTWLTLWQNVILGKLIKNFDVKEDSLVANSIASLIREWKTEQEINKILGLSTDSQGNFVDDTQFARREKLRKEFESKPWVKTYREAVLQHQGTIATLWQASWPWDVAAVFQFMKTLDPTSVVRESEFDTAASSAWVLEKFNAWNVFEKFRNGAILWEQDSDTREAFVKTVNELFKIKKNNYDWLARQMINQALRDGVDPRSVVLDLDEVPWASSLTRDSYTNLSDEDIIWIDDVYGFSTSDWQTFNINSWGFNTGDQTPWTKDIWLGTVTQDYGDVSPLSQDNVKLVDGRVWTPWIDIDGRIWDPIPSTVSWTVKIIKSNSWLGNRVVVIDENEVQHIFSHLNDFNVVDWQRIEKWQQIGTMGNSWSVIAWPWWDGSHLDYRVKSKQGWENPNKFLIW